MARALPLLVAALLAGSAQDAGWRPVRVPGPRAAADVGWYRAWVKVHDGFFSPHPRNLFEESVGLHIEGLAGAHEAWVNGTKLGDAGGPGLHRHKVPVGTLRKGAWNEIALRVSGAAGGFGADAPFIMNYFLECVLEGDWEYKAGGDYAPGPARAEKPAVAAFDRFRESNRVLGRAEQVHGPKLPPAESAARLEPGKDFAVDLLLHEPLVAQPFHVSFDERGRLWVAQSRQYPYPAGLTMISRDKYYRAHYDKVPPAPPKHDPGMDRISIHDLAGGSHKVFLDGLNMANAALRGAGGVWVMHTPYLLFYPDADGDDVPDGPPEVRLAGFNFEDTHAIANGLAWGPDGWLYGAQGSTTSCRVTRPGFDDPPVAFDGCMVWRYHPRSKAFELFAEGGGNTFGLEFDAHGRLYSGHNGGDTRGWHFVQGGFYQMQGADPGKYGPPRNPYAFGELPNMKTADRVGRFTHFGAFAEGTAMPSKHAGLLFALDPLHNTVTTSRRVPRGSTFDTVDLEPALKSSDPAFRPVHVTNAPDGSLVLADMYEFYIAHGQHYQNQIDPTSGRIYRLRGKDAPLETDVNLAAKSTPQLVALLSHPNKWHRHTAVRLLGERKDPAAAGPLRAAIAADPGLGALNALWALHQSAGLDEATAVAALSHPYAAVRLWTARLLGDDFGLNRNLGAGRHGGPGRLPDALLKALRDRVVAEKDPETLAQFASTLRRLDASQALPLVAALSLHDVAADPHIPLLCWWVLEAQIPAANAEILSLLSAPALWDRPLVLEHLVPRLARRWAVEGKRQDLLLVARLFELAPGPRHAAGLLKGLEDGFRGRPLGGLPDELLAGIRKSGRAPLVFRLRQGEAEAVAEALARVRDPKAPAEERLLFVRAFAELRPPSALPVLLELAAAAGPAEPRRASLAALSAYDDASVGAKVAELLPALDGELREAAFALLASRAKWGTRLLDAVRAGRVKAAEVPEDVAARLRAGPLAEEAGRLLRAPAAVPPETRAEVERIQAVLKGGAGDPYAGEALFEQRCAKCHKLFFKGGNVGPDLTAYQRDKLDTLLPSVVNPSAEIREGFQYYLVATTDDRVLSGFFVDRDNQVTVLRTLDGENVTLPAAKIRAVKPAGQSLMPAGLLDGLSERQLRDFFAYLRITQPITK